VATPIAGTEGHVRVGGTEVLEIKEWTADIERENYDASTLGVTWRRKVAGIGNWSGKLTGFYSVSDDVGQQALHNAIFNALSVELSLETQTNSYTGTAFPKKISIKNPVDGIVDVDIDFEGSDPLVFA
jgi:predicted secreted protein